jgi:SAM-dependent methyltransferase
VSEIETPAAVEEAGPWPQEWWKDFFAEDHVRFQIDLSEQAHDSDAEVSLLTRLAGIGHNTRLLDVPCGQGRHAVRFARAGALVTGLDASRAMIERAGRSAADRGVRIEWIHGDMRQMHSESGFDCVTCLGGSFGYFGNRGDSAFLETIRRALRPAGTLALDAPSLEYISSNHRPFDESVVGGRRVMQHRRLDAVRGIARIRVTIEMAEGPVSRTYCQQLYTAKELTAMPGKAARGSEEGAGTRDEHSDPRARIMLRAVRAGSGWTHRRRPSPALPPEDRLRVRPDRLRRRLSPGFRWR